MEKLKFDISGMTCSSCASHVNRAVSKLKGVKNVNVNLLLNNMEVEFDNKILKSDDIIQAVEKAGYGASLDGNKKESNKDTENKNEKNNLKLLKRKLIVSICFLIPLMYIAMHHMLPTPTFISNIFDGDDNIFTEVFTQFLLLIPIVYINRTYFSSGFKKIFMKSPNMDSLIAIGSTASIVYGLVSMYVIGYGLSTQNHELVHRYSMNIYFESAGTILTLITLGKYLEEKQKGKTGDAIKKLINLVPKKVTVIRNNNEIVIDTKDALKDDILVIKPGENIAVDGIVVHGTTTVDESSITGESIPVQKVIGDVVTSGTTNLHGMIRIQATKVGEDTTVSNIIKLVKEASSTNAPISRLADRVSLVFVPIVIGISIISCILWLISGQSLEFALNIAICVLVIACPCALGLATPVAIMVGTGVGAKHGILIKSAESLETLHLVDTVVLDKTGTITYGKPVVTDVISFTNNNDLLKIAGSLEKNSEHPLSTAILNKIEEEKIDTLDVSDFKVIPGKGICGKILKKEYICGNLKFLAENNVNVNNEISLVVDNLQNDAKTVLYVADKSSIIGIIAVKDVVKPSSYLMIKNLNKMGIDSVMITGDNKYVANSIAKEVGIKKVVSDVLPDDKEKEVRKLQDDGKKVAFVGDGINDSPALARADVGIAIGNGTDIAIESADVVLMKNDLMEVITSIKLSKKVISNIKMNLFWAFFYNSVGIFIASGVLYPKFGITLSPMIGALAMSLSSVCVVTNALRINKFKVKYEEERKMEKKIYEKNVYIEGMSCNHCKMSVEKALKSIDGVENVAVKLDDKKASITSTKSINNDEIKKVIEDIGFEVKDII